MALWLFVLPIVMFVWLLWAIAMVPRCLRAWRRLQYREFQAERAAAADLPPGTAKHLDRYTPELLQLGFAEVGDFRLTHTVSPSFTRVFLSPDRHSFAVIEDYEERKVYAFLSVFEDGTYLESCAMKGRQLHSEPGEPLQFNHLPGAPLEELWQSHVLAVSDQRQVSGSEPIELVPEQYVEVAAYAHRLVWWRLHNEGHVEEPPVPAPREMVEV